MDYNKLDRKAIKSWRIGQAIALAVVLSIFLPVSYFLWKSNFVFIFKILFLVGIGAIIIYAIIGLLVFPNIEYKQWGYKIEEDKVVIRHGIFFIKKTIIPIIRIQNITVSQGPINRALGLYKVSMALASGTFEIEGLDKDTADSICENLKNRLYNRVFKRRLTE